MSRSLERSNKMIRWFCIALLLCHTFGGLCEERGEHGLPRSGRSKLLICSGVPISLAIAPKMPTSRTARTSLGLTSPSPVPATGAFNDNTVGPFNAGWDFRYYWYDVSQFWIGSNGYIKFQSVGQLAQPFPTFPNMATPNDAPSAPTLVTGCLTTARPVSATGGRTTRTR